MPRRDEEEHEYIYSGFDDFMMSPLSFIGERLEKMKMRWAVFGTLVLFVLIGGGMYGCPQYDVYSKRLAGVAALAESESGRQVLVQTARAERDAATLRGERRIIDARAEAEANGVLIDRFGGPENYLRYLYIEMLKEQDGEGNTVIYVPTEAQIPIMEAGRTVQQPRREPTTNQD